MEPEEQIQEVEVTAEAPSGKKPGRIGKRRRVLKKGKGKKRGGRAAVQAPTASSKGDVQEKKSKAKEKAEVPLVRAEDAGKRIAPKKKSKSKPRPNDERVEEPVAASASGKGPTFARRYCSKGECQGNRWHAIKDSFESYIKPHFAVWSHLQDSVLLIFSFSHPCAGPLVAHVCPVWQVHGFDFLRPDACSGSGARRELLHLGESQS